MTVVALTTDACGRNAYLTAYGGTQCNLQNIRKPGGLDAGCGAMISFADLPFSFALDTALLPLTVPANIYALYADTSETITGRNYISEPTNKDFLSIALESRSATIDVIRGNQHCSEIVPSYVHSFASIAISPKKCSVALHKLTCKTEVSQTSLFFHHYLNCDESDSSHKLLLGWKPVEPNTLRKIANTTVFTVPNLRAITIKASQICETPGEDKLSTACRSITQNTPLLVLASTHNPPHDKGTELYYVFQWPANTGWIPASDVGVDYER